uniref:DUF5641 domain-containing protein n=1 Tax=Ditylenchus dipsaci TaxID=166011 RepID=A0A915D751_9BILA
MNSRPITYQSEEVGAPLALTPAHFLLPHSSRNGVPIADPEALDEFNPYETNRDKLIKSLLQSTKKLDQYWSQWRKEYLRSLRERQTPYSSANHRQPAVGEVVLIQEELAPRGTWKMGRINKLVESNDGVVRTAEKSRPRKSRSSEKHESNNNQPRKLCQLVKARKILAHLPSTGNLRAASRQSSSFVKYLQLETPGRKNTKHKPGSKYQSNQGSYSEAPSANLAEKSCPPIPNLQQEHSQKRIRQSSPAPAPWMCESGLIQISHNSKTNWELDTLCTPGQELHLNCLPVNRHDLIQLMSCKDEWKISITKAFRDHPVHTLQAALATVCALRHMNLEDAKRFFQKIDWDQQNALVHLNCMSSAGALKKFKAWSRPDIANILALRDASCKKLMKLCYTKQLPGGRLYTQAYQQKTWANCILHYQIFGT